MRDLNFAAGQTIAKLVSVKRGASGKVAVKNGMKPAAVLISCIAGSHRLTGFVKLRQ